MSKRKPLTEAQWLAEPTSYILLKYLQQHRQAARIVGGKRKLRLLSVGCCRAAWHLITNELCQRAIDVGERAADSKAKRTEVRAVSAEVNALVISTQDRMLALHGRGINFANPSPELQTLVLEQWMAYAAAYTLTQRGGVLGQQIVTQSVANLHSSSDQKIDREKQVQKLAEVDRFHADLIRDVYGNPFQTIPLESHWLSSNVRDLARTIYDHRAFERLPILADALMDAGCDNDGILDHCRGPGPHARGCSVVDLLLGKG
jgi:hypothetical protein